MSTTIDTSKLANALRAMGARLEREVQRGLDRVADAGMASLRGTTRFEDRTGNLRASFFAAGSGNDGFDRMLSAGMPYAVFLEFGTRRITPRPFMGDAREVVRDRLADEMNDAVSRALTR